MPSSPPFLVERSVRQCIDYTIFRQYKQVYSYFLGGRDNMCKAMEELLNDEKIQTALRMLAKNILQN